MAIKGVIIAAGDNKNNVPLAELIGEDDIVVCADGGYRYAKEQNLKVSAIIGDFDSMNQPDVMDSTEIITYKVEKDETDTQLCIDYLAKKGVKEILLLGALGGERFDHSIANIQLLEYALEKGILMKIADGNTEMFINADETTEIEGTEGDIVSVFALDIAEGISYKGLKYSLENGSLSRKVPYCVSNSMVDTKCIITVKKGRVLIIHIGGEKR